MATAAHVVTHYPEHEHDMFKCADLSEPNQQSLGSLVVEHTASLHSSRLLFAKDVPTFRAQDSHAL